MERRGLGLPSVGDVSSHYSWSTGSSGRDGMRYSSGGGGGGGETQLALRRDSISSRGRGGSNTQQQLALHLSNYSAREDKHSVSFSSPRSDWSSSISTDPSGSSLARSRMARPPPQQQHPPSSITQTEHPHHRKTTSSSRKFIATKSISTSRHDDDALTLEEESEFASLSGKPTLDYNSSLKSNLSKSSTRVSSTYERKRNSLLEGDKALHKARVTTVRRARGGKKSFRGYGGAGGGQSLLSLREEEEENSIVDEDSSANNFSLNATSKTSNNDASMNVPSTSSSARFDEMRTLLMTITPMQLEALIIQLLDIRDDNLHSNSFISVARRWEGTAEASRVLKFRKDARLVEMSLAEFKRYASNKAIFGIEECASIDEAMDLITLEFERLVSSSSTARQQSITDRGDDDDGQNSSHYDDEDKNNDDVDESCMQDFNASYTESLSSSNSSSYNDLVKGRATLQRSLRACTLPELRLIVDRLNLNYSGSNKSELILLIENSMTQDTHAPQAPGEMSNGSEVSSEFSERSSLQRPRRPFPTTGKRGGGQVMMGDYSLSESQDMSDAEYYAKYGPGKEDDGFGDDYFPNQNLVKKQKPNHRKVKFARDTKEDISHLTPKRENVSGWQSFVVGSRFAPDDADTDDDSEGALDRQNRNMFDMDGKIRRKYRRILLPSMTKYLRRRISGKKLRESCSLFLLIVLVVGLSVGLTTKKKNIDAESIIDLDDQAYQPLLFTKAPSLRPNMSVPAVAIFSISTPVPGNPSTKPLAESQSTQQSSPELAMSPSQQPSQKPAMSSEESPSVLQLFCAASEAELELSCATAESCISNPCPSNTYCFPFTCIDASFSGQNSPLVEAIMITNGPSPSATLTSEPSEAGAVVVSTYHPTEAMSVEQVYPLIGPVDESGMRMILYGVSSLTHMGRTQYTMLTAAYVEKFYNSEKKGDDAVQNIVYDVVASIAIEDEELLDTSYSGSSRRTLQRGDYVEGLIVTFTMTISYHTFSASIDLNTITNRPFFDEAMMSSYFKYMVAAGAAAHIGNIVSISPVFFGDDIPDTTVQTVNVTPSPSPSFNLMDVEEIPVTGQTIPGATTLKPTPFTSFEIIPSNLNPSVEELTAPDPSSLSIMSVTLEPSPATSLDVITLSTISPAPSTTMAPSSTPSGDAIPAEESMTPTFQPIDIIMAQDSKEEIQAS